MKDYICHINFRTLSNRFSEVLFDLLRPYMQTTISGIKTEMLDFSADLRRSINVYFKENSLTKNATAYYYVKAAVMALMLWGPFAALVFFDLSPLLYLLMWVIMGFGMSGVGMNVMHDANHGSVSKKQWVNKFFGSSMYLLSGNVFNWKVQHNVLHHTYTNLYGKDEDLDASGLLRLHPNEPMKKMHKYQVYYAPLLYSLLTLNWVLLKDWKQLARYTKNGLTKQMQSTFTKELIVLLLSKIAYFSVFIATPLLAGYGVGLTILGFVIMHALAGFILSLIFQMAHVVDEVQHPLDSSINPSTQFAKHQLATTSNFATRSRLVTFFTGGLNFQVEHHLFPLISHVHYPKISKIVKEVAARHGLPYYEHKTFMEAVRSHVHYLNTVGKMQTA